MRSGSLIRPMIRCGTWVILTEYSRKMIPRQTVLPGLEGYICTFDCLDNCPLAPDGGCFYEDSPPLYAPPIEYPEFFAWRFEQVFGDSKEFLIVTPDMLDEYFKEPEDPLQTRCPRCSSTEITDDDLHIKCQNCGYNEVLMDFPVSLSQAA